MPACRRSWPSFVRRRPFPAMRLFWCPETEADWRADDTRHAACLCPQLCVEVSSRPPSGRAWARRAARGGRTCSAPADYLLTGGKMDSDVLLYDVQDGIAQITLNRPDRLNAINGAMADPLRETLAAFDTAPPVRPGIGNGPGRAI